ncbi:hypothetical protein HanRHA438_Chr04g0154381 [Helianthus annuus]|nr:hypothetical protein HanRHA438_Chr04g0154381 [Helianthus annuus]
MMRFVRLLVAAVTAGLLGKKILFFDFQFETLNLNRVSLKKKKTNLIVYGF